MIPKFCNSELSMSIESSLDCFFSEKAIKKNLASWNIAVMYTSSVENFFQSSQIHKYNYKKNSMQLYTLNKKPRIYFFEKILMQTQGRKLITLGIFKLERNMQKQCLCGCFMYFQSMFGKWKNICFPHK